MEKTIKAHEARRRLGEVLDGVVNNNDTIIVERYGKPWAVIVPVSVFIQMQKDTQVADQGGNSTTVTGV